MSPIGRIFSVLNLVLAVWFLAWAVQTAAKNDQFKKQWTAEQTAHTATRTDFEDQIRRLRAELNSAESIAATQRNTADEKSREASRLTNELAAAKTQASDALATAQRFSVSYDELKNLLDNAIAEKDRAVEARHGAERTAEAASRAETAARSQLTDAQSQIRELNASIEEGTMTATQLAQTIQDLETDLDTLVATTGVSRSAITSQPQIEATVIQANYDIQPGLIALNAGADKGMKRGYTFEIYNGGTYKGQARVENVHATMSTALIVRAVDGVTVRQGDRATTRL